LFLETFFCAHQYKKMIWAKQLAGRSHPLDKPSEKAKPSVGLHALSNRTTFSDGDTELVKYCTFQIGTPKHKDTAAVQETSSKLFHFRRAADNHDHTCGHQKKPRRYMQNQNKSN